MNIPEKSLLPWFMIDRHDRLRIAWKRINMTRGKTAARFGWSINTFKSNLNGSASFGYQAAKEYAKAFGVRAEWLYDGKGDMTEATASSKAPIQIPVISWIAAGQLAAIADVSHAQADRSIALFDLPPGEYFSTEVRGDSMDRISPEGALIVVNAADKELLRGKPYLFCRQGEGTFKLWEPEPVPHLMPASTNPANRPIFLDGDDWSVIGRVYRSILNLV